MRAAAFATAAYMQPSRSRAGRLQSAFYTASLGSYAVSEFTPMDRTTAEKLMAIYHRLGNVLNEADPLIRGIPDEKEREAHLRALGTMMQDVWLELMAPVVREYRDLDPDKKP